MAYLNRGVVLLEYKQYDKAMNDFNKAIEFGPRNAQAYLGRGIALAFTNQFARAIEDLNRAIELNPKLATAYNTRGMVFAQIGNPRAAADFQKACEMGFEQGCSNWQRLLRNY
jgi:tetratricopeptide (TPR) repeat protein